MTLFLTTLAISAATIIGLYVLFMVGYVAKCLLETLLEIIVEACFAVSELRMGTVFRCLVMNVGGILLMAVGMWICCTVPDLIKV